MSLKKTIMTDDYSPFGSYYTRSQIYNAVLWMACLVITLVLINVVGMGMYSLLVYILPVTFFVWTWYDKKRGFARYMQQKYG